MSFEVFDPQAALPTPGTALPGPKEGGGGGNIERGKGKKEGVGKPFTLPPNVAVRRERFDDAAARRIGETAAQAAKTNLARPPRRVILIADFRAPSYPPDDDDDNHDDAARDRDDAGKGAAEKEADKAAEAAAVKAMADQMR